MQHIPSEVFRHEMDMKNWYKDEVIRLCTVVFNATFAKAVNEPHATRLKEAYNEAMVRVHEPDKFMSEIQGKGRLVQQALKI